MEPISALNDSPFLGTLITVCFVLSPNPILEIISEVFEKFNFHQESAGLLQFWGCYTISNSENIGCNLRLLDAPFRLTDPNHERLENYRRKSLEKVNTVVGPQIQVGNWFAGRAAQTGIADYRTCNLVLSPDYQQSAEAAGMGQCVLPVFYYTDGVQKLAGIIELVTSVPKESYFEDFNQIQQLLEDNGLESSYMGKTVKVEYRHHMIKFYLPLLAKFADLQEQVTARLPVLKGKHLCIKYEDTRGNILISNDDDLHKCMKESILKGKAFVQMFVNM